MSPTGFAPNPPFDARISHVTSVGKFDTTLECPRIARSGLPEIVPVMALHGMIGVGLTNIAVGANRITEMKKTTAIFQPVPGKANEG